MQTNGNSRYELLQYAKSIGIFSKMVYSGIISLNVAAWVDIYEKYLNYLQENNKTNSVYKTAEYYNLNERTIYRIITYMENK
jgi:hypothetical protein